MPSVILLPTAIGAHGDEWLRTGGSSKFNAVDPGDPIAHDDLTSRLHSAVNNRNQSMAFEDLSTKVPSAKTVVSVTFSLRMINQDGDPFQSLNVRSANSTILATDINFVIQVPKNNSTFFDFSGQLAPADGGDWTVAKADDVQMDWVMNGSMPENGLLSCTSVWIIVQYGETVTVVEPPDETAQRVLRRFRFPEEIYRLQLGARAEQIELWKDFRLVEAFGPETTGLGFGAEEWESRLLRCIRKTADPRTGNVVIEAIDVRRYLATFFLQMISEAPGKSIGTIRLDPGSVETFTRASKAWIEWKDGLAYELASGDKKHNHLGLLLEDVRKNRILNSAFDVDGGGGADTFASWVETVAGVSASSGFPYFADTDVSKQHLQITQTSPTEDRGVSQTTTTFAGTSGWVTLTLVHRDDGVGSGQLTIQVADTTTGKFLQADGSWAVSPTTFKPFPSRVVRTRESIVFQMEGSSTLILRLRTDFSVTTHIARVWQVDLLEDIVHESSPIVTYGSEVTVNKDELSYTNDPEQELVPLAGEQFTIQLIIRFLFGSDVDLDFDLPTGGPFQWIYSNLHQAQLVLKYNEDTTGGDNHFSMGDGEPGFGPVKPTFNALDEIKIVHRRASSRGEYDLGAGKEQIMVLDPDTGNWIEGIQVDVSDYPIQSDTPLSLTPNFGLFDNFSRYLVYMNVSPFVLTKEEAKDFP